MTYDITRYMDTPVAEEDVKYRFRPAPALYPLGSTISVVIISSSSVSSSSSSSSMSISSSISSSIILMHYFICSLLY